MLYLNGDQWVVLGGVVFCTKAALDPQSQELMIKTYWTQDAFVETKYALRRFSRLFLDGELPMDIFKGETELYPLELVKICREKSGEMSLAARMVRFLLKKFEAVKTGELETVVWQGKPRGESMSDSLGLAPLVISASFFAFLSSIVLVSVGLLYEGHVRSAFLVLEALYPELDMSSNDIEFFFESRSGECRVIVGAFAQQVIATTARAIKDYLQAFVPKSPIMGTILDEEADEVVI